jgi:methylated-DNA-[protein]-cysteine S-methyltransferase
MKQAAYCIFETPLGVCGIAWAEREGHPAVTQFQLPEATAEIVKSRLARNHGAREAAAPPANIAQIIERVCQHLRGEIQDFRGVTVDLDATPPFARQVYEVAREILAGQTRTYGDLAKTLGQPHAAQAVGQALGSNPIPLIIPCHRVLAAAGKLGGFSAPGGRATKERLLEIEGACVNRSLFGAS